jgi:hypothetical protein
LIADLCQALAAEDVRYCHWKSTTTLDRAQLGEGDLDLLVDRRHSQAFLRILRRLGFKPARAARELPGVFHAYGLDPPSGRLVHVHAHYVLVLGDDMTKNYRLPVEDAYLALTTQGAVFRVPAPEFELAMLVIRLVLKHAAWDAILIGRGPLSAAERDELADLTSRATTEEVRDCVAAQLPAVGESLWQDCARSLEPRAGFWFRAWTARRLEAALAGCARRPWAMDTLLKLSRRVAGFLSRRIVRPRSPRLQLDTGGALVVVLGDDHELRSRTVTAIHAWLARHFEAVAFVRDQSLRAGASARRRALGGTLVLCDGFPTGEPVPPDFVIALQSGPAAPGADPIPEAYRRHAPEVCLVDAARAHEDTLADVKAWLWSRL